MTEDNTGPDATPRIGLDLGRQVLEGSNEERIRRKAYEIWESEGRAGDPQDHWYRAERELSQGAREQSEATVEDAPPATAAGATETAGDQGAGEAANEKKARRKRVF